MGVRSACCDFFPPCLEEGLISFWHLILEKPSWSRAMARPQGLFLLKLGEIQPKLLSVLLEVSTAFLGVFLLNILLSMKESLCK